MNQKHMFKMYSDLMEYRIRLEGRAYLEEVIESMVHIVVHELFAELDSFAVKSLNDRVRQGDILFKRFIEMLAGGHVKQRSVNHYADRLFPGGALEEPVLLWKHLILRFPYIASATGLYSVSRISRKRIYWEN